ncbi:MAG: glycine betaine ABC transporter substrate-binding protein, partial [Aeoliella sp.]
KSPQLKGVILAAVGILQTIPSLALLTLLLTMLGKIGPLPAIIALTLYALLPIVRNTILGLEGVPQDAMEAAEGVGMTRAQQLRLVQLPLALPVIIGGIRTAAVIGVGIATLAAFIGAGGLGEFINRGLNLNNHRLILLGAIPAAILALAVDAAMGAAGWALDPVRTARQRAGSRRAIRIAAIILPFGLVAAATIGYFRNTADIHIGSKMFSESLILGHMMAMMIEDRTDLEVDERFGLGGTMICHEALANGEIDVYAEYTGTSLATVLREPTISDPDAVYEKVARLYREKLNLRVLAPFGFNNAYALCVQKVDAEQHGWKTISDLAKDAAELKAGWQSEFAERPDGYPGLNKTYGMKFAHVADIDAGLMYGAIKNGEVDVIAAYSTDGRIAAYDLVLLEDDRRFFPPYFAVPVVNGKTLKEHPELADALAPLAGLLDNDTMQKLNLAVDEHKRSPEVVAREFLVERGLITRIDP